MTGTVASVDTSGQRTTGGAPDLVRLDISRIRPYEHNPRRTANAEYDRIKASIRADGLNQPLVVTQRPGESHYVVHAGGNTRLRVLQELFDETGEDRFGAVSCVIRPWTGEADVLLSHLKENDLRGELSFVDKALAIADVKELLEDGADEPLTQASLAEILQRCGYGLSQGLISQMAYVVERLWPVLPEALEAGLGRPQVAKIRALDRAAKALWIERDIDTEAEYDQVFEALCRRYDAPDWDTANLRRAVEAEIAERGDISIHVVSMAIDAGLSGRSVAASPPSSPTDGDPAGHDGGTRLGKGQAATEAHRHSGPSHETPSPSASGGKEYQPDSRRPDAIRQSPNAPATRATGEAISPDAKLLTDLKSLRARLWTLASRLAQRNGFGDLVQPLPGRGLGFVLTDVPDAALVDQLDEDALAQVSMVWWHLAACAELTVAPLDTLLPTLPESSVLRRALVDQDAGLLFSSVWTLDPGHSGYRLWRRLDDRDWQDLVDLMETYRALHKAAASDDKSLWQ